MRASAPTVNRLAAASLATRRSWVVSYCAQDEPSVTLRLPLAAMLRSSLHRRSPWQVNWARLLRKQVHVSHYLRRKRSRRSVEPGQKSPNFHLENGRAVRYSGHMSMFCATAAPTRHPLGEAHSPPATAPAPLVTTFAAGPLPANSASGVATRRPAAHTSRTRRPLSSPLSLSATPQLQPAQPLWTRVAKNALGDTTRHATDPTAATGRAAVDQTNIASMPASSQWPNSQRQSWQTRQAWRTSRLQRIAAPKLATKNAWPTWPTRPPRPTRQNQSFFIRPQASEHPASSNQHPASPAISFTIPPPPDEYNDKSAGTSRIRGRTGFDRIGEASAACRG
jgi:hypothetical protein